MITEKRMYISNWKPLCDVDTAFLYNFFSFFKDKYLKSYMYHEILTWKRLKFELRRKQDSR